MQELVIKFIEAGLCLIPVKLDGTKAPALSAGHPFFRRQPMRAELDQWLSKPCGWGVVAGVVSRGLEIIDFDAGELFYAWRSEAGAALVDRLPVVKTPSGGWHVYYRCREICGSKVLAYDWSHPKLDEWQPYAVSESGEYRARQVAGAKRMPIDCLVAPINGRRFRCVSKRIETRGEGGFVVSTLSPPEVHRNGIPYEQVSGPELPEVPTIQPAERKQLWLAASEFCTVGEDPQQKLVAKLVSDRRNAQAAEYAPALDDEQKIARASKYLAAMPGAVSGADGHKATFSAACILVIGFALSPEQALLLLKNEFNPRCSPPWSERDLIHKINEATKQPGARGYKLSGRAI
jgi:hypothetical protein